MDLSGNFSFIMKRIFPHAKIICDKFHYVKLLREDLSNARIQCMKSIKDPKLYRVIKRNLHLFEQYKEKLNDKTSWRRGYFKNERTQELLQLTNKELVESILDLDECDELREAYDIYQSFLDILHKPQKDYKQVLNDWLNYIFETKNKYFLKTVKNFRKNWFLPILRSLSYTARYRRKGKIYETSFNNGFVEAMNNK